MFSLFVGMWLKKMKSDNKDLLGYSALRNDDDDERKSERLPYPFSLTLLFHGCLSSHVMIHSQQIRSILSTNEYYLRYLSMARSGREEQ